MTIEAQLQELIEVNKAILTALQSGAQMATAQFASAELIAGTAGTKKRRTKAEIAADEAAAATTGISTSVVDGDEEGTKYWHSEKNAMVFAQLPDEAAPAADSEFVQVSASVYTAAKAAYEKAEVAKKAQAAAATEKAAATQQASANTEHSATVQQDTASAATSANGDVTWDQAVKALKDLAGNPAHGGAAVLTIVKQIDPTAANVPALQALNKNAEIVAAVNALLNPGAASAEVDPLFG